MRRRTLGATPARGAAGGAGEAATLKIKLGRGEAPCAPEPQDKIDVAQSSQHFNLQTL